MEKLRDRVGAIIIKDKKLLLVSVEGQDICWTPGGRFGGNESPEKALCRELREELQVKTKSSKFLMTSEYTDTVTGGVAKSHLYLVEIEGDPIPDNEIDQLHWYAKDDFNDSNIKEASATVSADVVPKLIQMGLL